MKRETSLDLITLVVKNAIDCGALPSEIEDAIQTAFRDKGVEVYVDLHK